MAETQNLIVAETIRDQIKAADPSALMAWGASAFVGGEDFLMFRVRGMKMKGVVQVKLNTSEDLYEIKFFKGLGKPKLIDEIKGVYCDMLMETIDRRIER